MIIQVPFFVTYIRNPLLKILHFLSLASLCHAFRWLKFEEDVEDGGERWSKPYVATLSLHSLFELRSCLINGTVLLDMRANSIEEISGEVRGVKAEDRLWCGVEERKKKVAVCAWASHLPSWDGFQTKKLPRLLHKLVLGCK